MDTRFRSGDMPRGVLITRERCLLCQPPPRYALAPSPSDFFHLEKLDSLPINSTGEVGKKVRLHVKRPHCFSAAVAAEASAAECLEQIDIDQTIIENASHLD